MGGADIIGGLGIGLCFSNYWPVGIVLMLVATLIVFAEKDFREELKRDIKKKLKHGKKD